MHNSQYNDYFIKMSLQHQVVQVNTFFPLTSLHLHESSTITISITQIHIDHQDITEEHTDIAIVSPNTEFIHIDFDSSVDDITLLSRAISCVAKDMLGVMTIADEVLHSLTNILSGKESWRAGVLIQGCSGVGKTTFMKSFHTNLIQHSTYVDCSSLYDVHRYLY
jgi:predicted ATPase